MRIAYLRSTFPKNSETFIMEEIRCLIAAGHEVRVFSQMAELDALQPKMLEHRLAEHVVYAAEPLMWPRRVWSLMRFAGRMVLRRGYARGYWINLFPDRSKRTAIVGKLRSDGLGAALPLFVRSSEIHNLSLAVAESESIEGAVSPTDFVPDVVHCPFMFDWEVKQLGRLVEAAPQIPFTVVLRSRDLHRDQSDDQLYPLKVSLLGRAARILTISRFNRDHVLAGGSPHARAAARPGAAHGIRVVHSAIDTTFFAPTAGAEKQAGQIACVARLIPKKGLHQLIEACAVLRQRGLDVRCVIVGDGALKGALVQLIGELGLEQHVTLQASCTQHDVRRILSQSEVFALPCVVAADGDRDMLPNSLKEAMAMELPVVTSDISGIDELVTHEVDGLLVPPDSALALADAIARLLRDPGLRARLGRAGREVIVRDFDVASESRKLIEVLSEVVAARR